MQPIPKNMPDCLGDTAAPLPFLASWGYRPKSTTGIIKTARTIADMAGEERIATPYLAEVIHYR